MRLRFLIVLVAALFSMRSLCLAGKRPQNAEAKTSASTQECISISDAQKHVGRTRCVSGTVVRVEGGTNGVTFLDFCADYRSCPFTVVVFPGDLRNVGDVHQLQGHAVRIKGTIEEYDERAEIILRHPQQLGDAALLPVLPKDYDVERRGNFSAGTFREQKAKHSRVKRQGPPIAITDPTDEP